MCANRISRFLCLAAWLVFALSGGRILAATAFINPSADTSLLESLPDNNIGGQPFMPDGSSEQSPRRHRALMKFNIAAAIPAGARVQSVTLTMAVVQQPG